MPPHSKPKNSSWRTDEKIRNRIESLEAYAIDDCRTDDQKKTAAMVTLTFLSLMSGYLDETSWEKNDCFPFRKGDSIFFPLDPI